jgi:hypothetical protein
VVIKQLTEGKKEEAQNSLGACVVDQVWKMEWENQESRQSAPVPYRDIAAARASIFQMVEGKLGADSQCHLDLDPGTGSAEVVARPGQSCK